MKYRVFLYGVRSIYFIRYDDNKHRPNCSLLLWYKKNKGQWEDFKKMNNVYEV